MSKSIKNEHAILFNRVSTKGQVSESKFNETRNKAKKYCDEIGLVLRTEKYIHAGSAYKYDVLEGDTFRKIFKQKKDGILPARCHLIIANADRFSRQHVMDSLNSLTNLCKQGFIIHDLNSRTRLDPEDKDNIGAIMYFAVCLQRGYEESARKSGHQKDVNSIKVRLGMESKKKTVDLGKGEKLICRILPKWISSYDEVNDKFILNEEEVFKIKYIVKRLVEGVSAVRVCKELNDKAETDKKYAFSVYTKGNKKKFKRYTLWSVGTLKRVYSNRALLGELHFLTKRDVTHHGVPRLDDNGVPLVIKDYYPRLIEDATFAKLNSQISKRKLSGKESTKPSIFSHLIYCGYCRNTDGSKITNGRRIHKRAHDKRIVTFCKKPSYPSNSCTSSFTLEENLQSVLLRYMNEIDLGTLLSDESGSKADELKNEIFTYEKDLADAKAEEKNLVNAVKSGIKSKAIKDALEEAEKTVRLIEKNIKFKTAELNELQNNVLTNFDKTRIKELSQLLDDDENVFKLNTQLKFIVESIETYPLGLPYIDCLNLVGKEYGKEKNRIKLYGREFPAFKINFVSGISRTVIYKTDDISKAIIINNENRIKVSLDWGKTTLDKMTALGSSKSELNALDRGIFAVIQSWKGITKEKWQKEYIERFFKPAHQKKLKKMIAQGVEIII